MSSCLDKLFEKIGHVLAEHDFKDTVEKELGAEVKEVNLFMLSFVKPDGYVVQLSTVSPHKLDPASSLNFQSLGDNCTYSKNSLGDVVCRCPPRPAALVTKRPSGEAPPYSRPE